MQCLLFCRQLSCLLQQKLPRVWGVRLYHRLPKTHPHLLTRFSGHTIPISSKFISASLDFTFLPFVASSGSLFHFFICRNKWLRNGAYIYQVIVFTIQGTQACEEQWFGLVTLTHDSYDIFAVAYVPVISCHRLQIIFPKVAMMGHRRTYCSDTILQTKYLPLHRQNLTRKTFLIHHICLSP